MSDTLDGLKQKNWTPKKLVAVVLFGAIIIVFVFFGLSSKLSGAGTSVSLGKVNSTLLSLQDLQQKEAQISQQYQAMFGANFDIGSQRGIIRSQAVQALVQTELISQHMEKDQLVSTDSEIAHFITKEIPAFQENGRFVRENYDRYLANSGNSAAKFEKILRKDIAMSKYQRLAFGSGNMSPDQSKALAELGALQWNLSYAKISKSALGSDDKAQEAAMKLINDQLEKSKSIVPESVVNNYKLTFAETGFIPVSSTSIATLPGGDVAQLLMDWDADRQVAPRLAQVGEDWVIIKVKGLKKGTATAKEIEAAQKKLSGLVFDSWMNQFKKSSKVEINPQAVQVN